MKRSCTTTGAASGFAKSCPISKSKINPNHHCRSMPTRWSSTRSERNPALRSPGSLFFRCCCCCLRTGFALGVAMRLHKLAASIEVHLLLAPVHLQKQQRALERQPFARTDGWLVTTRKTCVCVCVRLKSLNTVHTYSAGSAMHNIRLADRNGSIRKSLLCVYALDNRANSLSLKLKAV